MEVNSLPAHHIVSKMLILLSLKFNVLQKFNIMARFILQPKNNLYSLEVLEVIKSFYYNIRIIMTNSFLYFILYSSLTCLPSHVLIGELILLIQPVAFCKHSFSFTYCKFVLLLIS